MRSKFPLWYIVGTLAASCMLACESKSRRTATSEPAVEAAPPSMAPPELELDYDSFDQRPGTG
ncbi:MAG: hypothetical protein ACYSWU_21160, partial [Planctomycetota bacterium]